MAIKLTTTEDVLGNKRGVQVVPTVEDVFGILQKGFKNLINAYYGSYYFGVTQQATLALLGVADSIYSPKNLAEQAGLDISDPDKQITIFDFASGKLAENPRYGYFTAKVSDNSWDTSSANFTSILGPGMTEPRNGCEVGITCFFVDIAQNNGSNRLGGSANWSQDTKRWDIYPDNEVVIDNDTIIDVDGKIAVALDLINAQGNHSVILRTTDANTATGANDLVAGEGSAVSGNNNIVGGKGHAVPFSSGFAVGTFSQSDTTVETSPVPNDTLLGVVGNGSDNQHRSNVLAIFDSGYIRHHGVLQVVELKVDSAPVTSTDVVRKLELDAEVTARQDADTYLANNKIDKIGPAITINETNDNIQAIIASSANCSIPVGNLSAIIASQGGTIGVTGVDKNGRQALIASRDSKTNANDTLVAAARRAEIGLYASESAILGGWDNKIENTTRSVILGGDSNKISLIDASATGGIINYNIPYNYGFVIGGVNNLVQYKASGTIGGEGLKTTNDNQVLTGRFNDTTKNDLLFAIGNGTAENARSNAFEITDASIARAYGAPVDSNDIVRKLELDTLTTYSNEEFVHKTADSLQLYGTTTTGNKQQIQITYTIATGATTAEAGKIPQYRAVGNVSNIVAPTATIPVAEPTWEYDAANKRYADRNFLHIQEGTQTAPVILTDVIIGDANQQNGVRDLTVTGDLIVKGTQHTVDQETIQSQANLIVTNSSNAPLVGGTGVVSLAGNDFDYEAIALTAQTYVANKYYIKDASDNYILAEGAFDATETYYLRKAHSYAVAYYNATADAVQIGLGTYKNDEFTFDEAYSKVILTVSTYQPDIYYTRTGEGTELSPYVYTLATGDFDASATYYSRFSEGQNVATRADSSFWFDHHLAEWDADAYTFIDSGLATDAVKSHLADTNNPHAVTKQQVGLGNVANERQYSAENPNLSSALPLMDGTASAGVATTYSHSDHVHPSDTAKVDKTTTIAGLDLSESRSPQALTDALIYCNTTTDIDYVMGD